MGIFFKLEKVNLKYAAACGGSAAACVLMLIFPETVLYSAQKGIAIWANNILPAMLPFFICANFMNSMGITRHLKPGSFAFSMSALSGYPMGAKIIGDMGRNGYISKKECRNLISFCSTSGPAFMIGSVGTAMLGNSMCGFIIAIAHFSAAVVNGIIFSFFNSFSKNERIYKQKVAEADLGKYSCGNLLETFTNAIFSSFKSLGIILAYLVIFMMFTDILSLTGVFSSIKNPFYQGMLKGIFEMTLGCSLVCGNIGIPLFYKTAGCAALISFGGFSIIGQSMSMLSGTGISLKYLLAVKLMHGILAFFLAAAMLLILF